MLKILELSFEEAEILKELERNEKYTNN